MISEKYINKLKKKYAKKDKMQLKMLKAELYQQIHDTWKSGGNVHDLEIEYQIVCELLTPNISRAMN
jgi:hypothetical protein